MRKLIALATATATLSFAAPALADDHGPMHSHELSAADMAHLAGVLGDERRAEDRARDAFRNPAQTLRFFQVKPGHAVGEYAPGGGWYTRVIAPYVGEQGRYVGLNFGPNPGVPERFHERLRAFPSTFPQSVVESTGIAAERVSAYVTGDAPEEMHGTLDRVLIIRMLHNMVRWGIADTELMKIRQLLKDDGMVGIVQHEAPEGMSYAMTDGNRGYLQKSDVIALMELYGFELVDESFVNTNPRDNADHPAGVWTLPPSFARGDEDRETYAAIGESNRMTLLFRKAE